jgi:methylmalonyl-CoA mutase cobalamin-binding subunit
MMSRVLLTTIPSDAHGWNLVFLQMYLEERGHRVRNLGTCVPYELLEESCREQPYDLVVVSTINGHGHMEGLEVARLLARLEKRRRLKLVIGGKLGVEESSSGEHARALLRAGFDAVFFGPSAVDDFGAYLEREIGEVEVAREASGLGA